MRRASLLIVVSAPFVGCIVDGALHKRIGGLASNIRKVECTALQQSGHLKEGANISSELGEGDVHLIEREKLVFKVTANAEGSFQISVTGKNVTELSFECTCEPAQCMVK
jgi:hypothetical protein